MVGVVFHLIIIIKMKQRRAKQTSNYFHFPRRVSKKKKGSRKKKYKFKLVGLGDDSAVSTITQLQRAASFYIYIPNFLLPSDPYDLLYYLFSSSASILQQ